MRKELLVNENTSPSPLNGQKTKFIVTHGLQKIESRFSVFCHKMTFYPITIKLKISNSTFPKTNKESSKTNKL